MKKTVLLALFSMLFSVGVHAAQNGFEVMSFRPATDNGRYLSVWDSNILDRDEWFFGTTLDYGAKPLQTTGNDATVLNKIFEQHLYSSFGLIKDRLELGIDMPIGWMLNYKNPRIPGTSLTNKTSFGDLLLNAKISLLDMKKSGFGLAVLPFISFPTGNSDYFFGSGVVTAGGSLIAEINPSEKLFVAMNLGLLGKQSYIFRNVNDSSKLMGGLGIAFAATKNLNISSDFLFKTKLSGVFQKRAETPIELLTGVKYAIANTGFVVNGAVGAGIISGTGAPQYRIVAGLGYSLPPYNCTASVSTVEFTEEDLSTLPANSYYKATVTEITFTEPSATVTEITFTEPSTNFVHFAFDSVKIEAGADTAMLDSLVDVLRKDSTKKLVVVEGNADNIGSKYVNESISKRRAQAVSKYFSDRGIDQSRMTIVGYGSEKPIADNNTEEGRQANRRVEVKIQ